MLLFVQCGTVMVRQKVNYVDRPLAVSIFSNVAPFEKCLEIDLEWCLNLGLQTCGTSEGMSHWLLEHVSLQLCLLIKNTIM